MSARNNAIRTARCWVMDCPLIIDTETTGLQLGAEIVELAIINAQGRVLFNELIKPTTPILFQAMAIHHITNAMVKDKQSFGHHWSSYLRGILKNNRVLSYNWDFDHRLINQSIQANNCELPDLMLSWTGCIMKLYAGFYGDFSTYRQDYKWQRLEDAFFQCELKPLGKDAHRALADAEMARQILWYMAGASEEEE